MAVIRNPSPTLAPALPDEMLAVLKQELAAPPSLDAPLRQPLIIEQDLPQTQTLHVAVVWEKWRLVEAGERSAMVLHAYERAAPGRVDAITIAMGVTTDEAIDLGLLPYGIIPTIKKDEPLTRDAARVLMREEGAVDTPSGLMLAFPNEESATAAYRRLVAKTKPEYWTITQAVRSTV